MCSYNSQEAHNPHFDIVYLTYTTFSVCVKVWDRSEKCGTFASVRVLLVKDVYLKSEGIIMGFKCNQCNKSKSMFIQQYTMRLKRQQKFHSIL